MPATTKVSSTGADNRPLSPKALGKMADLFKLLADPTRLRIVQVLCSGEQSVGNIVKLAKSSQANVSKHLALLAVHRVVRRRRHGLKIFYTISEPLILDLCHTVKRSFKARR